MLFITNTNQAPEKHFSTYLFYFLKTKKIKELSEVHGVLRSVLLAGLEMDSVVEYGVDLNISSTYVRDKLMNVLNPSSLIA